MHIAGLLSRDVASVGLKRGLRICIFHQFPSDTATAGLGTNFEKYCSTSVSAQSRKMATRADTFAGHSSSHQERLTLSPTAHFLGDRTA